MIVVDTSAVIAIALGEREGEAFTTILLSSDRLLIPPSCLLEASIALRRRFARSDRLDGFVASFQPEIPAIDASVARIARDADQRYGRGANHPARLNFGDCLAYAVAKHLDAPLLYKGNDFIHTDIVSAVPA